MNLYVFNRRSRNFIKYIKLISEKSNCKNLEYSKSYSNDLMVIATCNIGTVGVDIEKKVLRSRKVVDFYFNKYCSFNIRRQYQDEEIVGFYKT